MFNPISQANDLRKMRSQAMEIQRKLQVLEATVDKNGVQIIVTGDQRVKELHSNGRGDNDIKEAVNEAMKKAQEMAARELSQMQGGLSSLLGGK